MTYPVRAMQATVAPRLQQIRKMLASQRNVSDVLRWLGARETKQQAHEVIPQDEYTHDLVVQEAEEMYLVYDIT